MGRTEFSRTVTTSIINASEVAFKDGQVTATPVIAISVNGKVDEVKAMDFVRKAYDKKKQYVITSVTTKEVVYEISVEDFMKYAHVVIPATPNTDPTPDTAGNKAE